MPTTRFLLLAILVTGLSAVAGCRLYCQHDVHRRLAQLHREYPDGYDTLIDSLLRAPCVQGQASVLIADQDQPASIRAAGPSFVKIDARGYLVLYSMLRGCGGASCSREPTAMPLPSRCRMTGGRGMRRPMSDIMSPDQSRAAGARSPAC